MPTVTKRLSVLHWNVGMVGTLAYTVRGPLGTHISRRTTGVTAGTVSGRRYFVDAAINPTWEGAEVFWDDGVDEARGPVDVRPVMPAATKRFSVDWEVTGASLYYTIVGPGDVTLLSRRNTSVTAGGVSGTTYSVDLAVQPSWIGAEIVWDDGTDEQSEPISGGQTLDVNVISSSSTSDVLFDGDAAGESTTTAIAIGEAYDVVNLSRYVGAELFWTSADAVEHGRITDYTDAGSGESVVTVSPAFTNAPTAGDRLQIVRGGTGAGGDNVNVEITETEVDVT